MSDRKPKILIVQDDGFLLPLYSRKFLAEGFIVHGVRSAREALEEAMRILADIIILEIALPDEDGLSVLKKLKRHKVTAATPVVMFSNISERPYQEQARVFGASAYMIKSHYTPTEVVYIIKELLRPVDKRKSKK